MKKNVFTLTMLVILAACGQYPALQGPEGKQGPQGEAGQAGKDGNDAVAELIDPCGDGPGYDEVLIRYDSGELVAYFESGGKRFLSVIGEGSYVTTDQQACNFSVDAEGNVSW